MRRILENQTSIKLGLDFLDQMFGQLRWREGTLTQEAHPSSGRRDAIPRSQVT